MGVLLAPGYVQARPSDQPTMDSAHVSGVAFKISTNPSKVMSNVSELYNNFEIFSHLLKHIAGGRGVTNIFFYQNPNI